MSAPDQPADHSPELRSGELSQEDGSSHRVEQLAFEQMAAWAGPLPPPNAFREYDAALPGASERILRMAEKNLEHNHTQEDKLNQAAIQRAANGQSFAIIFASTAMTASIVFFATGHQIAGGVLLSPPVVMLVRTLLGRSPKDDKEDRSGK